MKDSQRAGAILVWGQAELGLCSLEKILGKLHLKGFLEKRSSDSLHGQVMKEQRATALKGQKESLEWMLGSNSPLGR